MRKKAKTNALVISAQSEIKAEIFKEEETKKEQCPECSKWVKKLDEENGICGKCIRKYE